MQVDRRMVGAQCRSMIISSTSSTGEARFTRGARADRLPFALCMLIAYVFARAADAHGRKHVHRHSHGWQQWQQ